MSVTCPTFGWELLTLNAAAELKSEDDILVCFVHFALVSLNFKSVGLGQSKTLYGVEVESETLPRGWSDTYAIRYIMQKQLYLLKGLADNGVVTVTLQGVTENKTSFVSLPSSYVARHRGSLEQMIPEYGAVFNMIRCLLINTLDPNQISESCTTLKTASSPGPGHGTFSEMSIRTQIPVQELSGWEDNVEEVVVMKSPDVFNLLGHFQYINSKESVTDSEGFVVSNLGEDRASGKSDVPARRLSRP